MSNANFQANAILKAVRRIEKGKMPESDCIPGHLVLLQKKLSFLKKIQKNSKKYLEEFVGAEEELENKVDAEDASEDESDDESEDDVKVDELSDDESH